MKEVPIRDFIQGLGTHMVEVCGANENGEGPKANIEINIDAVPINYDNGNIYFMHPDGRTLDYIASCGQEVKIFVRAYQENKQLPDSITIDNAEYTYTKISTQEGIIDIKKITGSPVFFHFGELPDCYHYFKAIYGGDPIQHLYDYEFDSSIPYYSTWGEMCEERDEFRIGVNGVEYLAPDNNWYALYNSSKQQYQASDSAGGSTGNHLIYYIPN